MYGDDVNITNLNNCIALGHNISISHNDATVFADTSNRLKSSNGENTLTLDYSSGIFIENNCFLGANLNIEDGLFAS